MSTALGLPKDTSPKPLTFDQVTVVAPGGFGRPSSETFPSRLADPGRVTVWPVPAETRGGWFVAGPTGGKFAASSWSWPSFSSGRLSLSTPRSTTK